MVPALLRIGEVAHATGVTTSALRFYEAQGLITPAERTASGYRCYDAENVARVAFIRTAQRLGLSLTQVADLLAAVDGDDPVPARDRLRDLVTEKIATTQHQIEDLQAFTRQLERVRARLSQGPGCGCRHLGTCGCLPLPLPPEKPRAVVPTGRDDDSCACCSSSPPG